MPSSRSCSIHCANFGRQLALAVAGQRAIHVQQQRVDIPLPQALGYQLLDASHSVVGSEEAKHGGEWTEERWCGFI